MIDSLSAVEFINLVSNNSGKIIKFRFDGHLTEVIGTIPDEMEFPTSNWLEGGEMPLRLINIKYTLDNEQHSRPIGVVRFFEDQIFTDIEFLNDSLTSTLKSTPKPSFKKLASKFL